ncbi:hypothetical protein AX774_g2762 [Zancudomyces culisetae]|uniref:Pleckstrin homology domain-containing protein n=1 Tax=Zancudomyces culisetae TaxID=1213189 RepID=A0A1R1PS06_ZANCU|nr:hypothetical protein AX774_g2762 [Zancudomyces culisetae]|eukprot:OMH83747.1 hypothetical protein AX774_g2762 [Zancudomyces culisetae]
MPPPGYSKKKPHVVALSASADRLYLFQTASDAEAQYWASVMNFWAALDSSVPDPSSFVTNKPVYGWNQVATTKASVRSISSTFNSQVTAAHSESNNTSSPVSFQESTRSLSSVFSPSGSFGTNATNFLREFRKQSSVQHWTPPLDPFYPASLKFKYLLFVSSNQSSQPNQVSQSNQSNQSNQSSQSNDQSDFDFFSIATADLLSRQLCVFTAHIALLDNELSAHQLNYLSISSKLKSSSISGSISSTSNSSSQSKAHSVTIHNWEKRSQYLLAELIKYKNYLDLLERIQSEISDLYMSGNNHYQAHIQTQTQAQTQSVLSHSVHSLASSVKNHSNNSVSTQKTNPRFANSLTSPTSNPSLSNIMSISSYLLDSSFNNSDNSTSPSSKLDDSINDSFQKLAINDPIQSQSQSQSQPQSTPTSTSTSSLRPRNGSSSNNEVYSNILDYIELSNLISNSNHTSLSLPPTSKPSISALSSTPDLNTPTFKNPNYLAVSKPSFTSTPNPNSNSSPSLSINSNSPIQIPSKKSTKLNFKKPSLSLMFQPRVSSKLGSIKSLNQSNPEKSHIFMKKSKFDVTSIPTPASTSTSPIEFPQSVSSNRPETFKPVSSAKNDILASPSIKSQPSKLSNDYNSAPINPESYKQRSISTSSKISHLSYASSGSASYFSANN